MRKPVRWEHILKICKTSVQMVNEQTKWIPAQAQEVKYLQQNSCIATKTSIFVGIKYVWQLTPYIKLVLVTSIKISLLYMSERKRGQFYVILNLIILCFQFFRTFISWLSLLKGPPPDAPKRFNLCTSASSFVWHVWVQDTLLLLCFFFFF